MENCEEKKYKRCMRWFCQPRPVQNCLLTRYSGYSTRTAMASSPLLWVFTAWKFRVSHVSWPLLGIHARHWHDHEWLRWWESEVDIQDVWYWWLRLHRDWGDGWDPRDPVRDRGLQQGGGGGAGWRPFRVPWPQPWRSARGGWVRQGLCRGQGNTRRPQRLWLQMKMTFITRNSSASVAVLFVIFSVWLVPSSLSATIGGHRWGLLLASTFRKQMTWINHVLYLSTNTYIYVWITKLPLFPSIFSFSLRFRTFFDRVRCNSYCMTCSQVSGELVTIFMALVGGIICNLSQLESFVITKLQ